MSEQFVEMFVTVEDAAYIRRERLAGDPDRYPDETTEEDVIEALIRRGASRADFIERKNKYTAFLRSLIRRGIDLTD